MRNKIFALLAATTATTIYGVNHTIAKLVMPHYIGSLGFVLLRVLGATLMFWFLSLFFKSKPIEKEDRFTLFKSLAIPLRFRPSQYFGHYFVLALFTLIVAKFSFQAVSHRYFFWHCFFINSVKSIETSNLHHLMID